MNYEIISLGFNNEPPEHYYSTVEFSLWENNIDIYFKCTKEYTINSSEFKKYAWDNIRKSVDKDIFRQFIIKYLDTNLKSIENIISKYKDITGFYYIFCQKPEWCENLLKNYDEDFQILESINL